MESSVHQPSLGLEVKDGQTAPSEDELKAHCKATLPRYMCPGKSPGGGTPQRDRRKLLCEGWLRKFKPVRVW